jgi:beta-glucuronidase
MPRSAKAANRKLHHKKDVFSISIMYSQPMIRTSLLLFSLAAICYNAGAQADLIQNINARNIQTLDGRWHYIIDPYKTGEGSKYYLNRKPKSKSEFVEYDFNAAPTLAVPGDWNSQDEKLLYYEGTVWYERDFNVHVKTGMRYFINFGAVNYQTHVYLNGKELGTHIGGFTPFQFEVTNLLQEGNNFIVVKADDTRQKESVPT